MAKFKKGDRVKTRIDTGTVLGYDDDLVGVEHDTKRGHSCNGMFGEIERGYWYREESLELITATTTKYYPITPKVGEKYRVLKDVPHDNWNGYFRKGAIVTIKSNLEWTSDKQPDDYGWYMNGRNFTTEYLELVSGPAPTQVTTGKRMLTGLVVETCGNGSCTVKVGIDYVKEEPIKQPKKYTLMKTITSALKKLLSPQLQKFYKVGYIDEGLTLTGNGRQSYVEALFQNGGDHTKALAEMEETADEIIKEADKE